jgi:hypothetical protein
MRGCGLSGYQLTPKHICFAAALLCSFAGTTWAQTSTPSITAPTTVSTTLTAPVPYQDRVIQGLPADDAEDINQRAYNNAGLPRSYSLEGLWDQQSSQGQRRSGYGMRANGFFDTAYYGSISGQLTLQNTAINNASGSLLGNAGQTSATSFVVRQVGMRFDGGWRADNAIGMLNLPTIELARSSPRLTLPVPAMQGVTTQWQQSQGLNLLAGWGRAGGFKGFPVAGFKTTQGSYGVVGLQKNQRVADGAWQWGGTLAQASQVASSFASDANGQTPVDARAAYAAVRREWVGRGAGDGLSNPDFVQFNLLNSSNTGGDFAGTPNPSATGLWADGGFTQGSHRHSWGLFALQPGLGWLDTPTASDLQGGYWRHGWRTRQWSLDSGLELLSPVQGNTPHGFFANTSARYQYSTATSFGTAINVRRYGVQSQSLLLYSQFANALGNTRAQLDVASANTGEQQTKVQLDHDWTIVQNMRLSTALSLDQERRPSTAGFMRTNGVGFATSADWTLGQRWSFNTSVQGRWSNEQTQYTLNAGATWRIAPQWSLQTTVYATQGNYNSATALTQSPLTAPAATVSRTQDAGVFVSLRYEDSAGRPKAPVGGAPGSAAGRLNGSVYLDDNQNAKRDAAERGAANVTVLLDGKYSTQTDAQGRFEFAYVTAAHHVLTVVSDNLPLPWLLDKEGRTTVRVYTRETTTVHIGAIKP